MAKREQELTELQQKFVQEYVKDFNATKAAIRAGYSPASAKFYASKLLDDPRIIKAINELTDATQAIAQVKLNINIERVLKELADIAFSRDTRIATKDKLKALELLGKHLGMFREKHEISGPDGGVIEVRFVEPEQ